jgi:Uri superfamily endonuclease
MVGDLPALPGAYLLLLEFENPLDLGPVGRLGEVRLAPALYAYAGSAKGPGSLAARITRHLARHKRPHWHIDRLARKRARQTIFVWPDGEECALIRQPESEPCTQIPFPGFGSSDCRVCTAHLVALPRPSQAAVAARLGQLGGRWLAPRPELLQAGGKRSS